MKRAPEHPDFENGSIEIHLFNSLLKAAASYTWPLERQIIFG